MVREMERPKEADESGALKMRLFYELRRKGDEPAGTGMPHRSTPPEMVPVPDDTVETLEGILKDKEGKERTTALRSHLAAAALKGFLGETDTMGTTVWLVEHGTLCVSFKNDAHPKQQTPVTSYLTDGYEVAELLQSPKKKRTKIRYRGLFPRLTRILRR